MTPDPGESLQPDRDSAGVGHAAAVERWIDVENVPRPVLPFIGDRFECRLVRREVSSDDLQRVELAFPAEAMLHVVDHGADTRDPAVQRVRRLMVGTVDEALAGLADQERRKLRTRLDHTMRAFLAPIVAVGGRVDVVGLIAWRVLAAVLDAEILVLPEGAPLSDALEEIRPALERASADPIALGRVEAEWSAALARLQALGLYAGRHTSMPAVPDLKPNYSVLLFLAGGKTALFH